MADTGRFASKEAQNKIITTDRIKTVVKYGTPVAGAALGFMGGKLLAKKIGKYDVLLKIGFTLGGMAAGYFGGKTINNNI